MDNTLTPADDIAVDTYSWRQRVAQKLYKNVVPSFFSTQYPGWKMYISSLRMIINGTHDEFADPAMITVYTIKDYIDPVILTYWDQSEFGTENREWKITVANRDRNNHDELTGRKTIHIVQQPQWYQYTVTDAV